jgi:hypothetical protein
LSDEKPVDIVTPFEVPSKASSYKDKPLGLLLSVLAVATVAAGLWISLREDGPLGIVYVALGISAISVLARSPFGTIDEEAERTRERINRHAGRPSIYFAGDVGGTLNLQVGSESADEAAVRASVALRRQEEILLEIYTQGLAQAKLSFRISVFFAGVGASLLLVGVGLAVVRAPSDGERYATIVAGVAGTVTNLISGVFFLQSNRARKNMGEQGVMLREESQEDRRVNTARELAASIGNEDLRDRVRADLALLLVDGSPRRPPFEPSSRPSQESPRSARGDSYEGPEDGDPESDA